MKDKIYSSLQESSAPIGTETVEFLIKILMVEYHADAWNPASLRNFVIKTVMTNLDLFSDQFINIIYQEKDRNKQSNFLELIKSISENLFNADIQI